MSHFLKYLETSSAEAAYIAEHEDAFAALSTSVDVWSRPHPELPEMAVVVRPDAALIWRVADGLNGDESNVVVLPDGVTPSILRDALYGPRDCLSYVVGMHRAVVSLSDPAIDLLSRKRAIDRLNSTERKFVKVLQDMYSLSTLQVPVPVAAHASAAMDIFHDALLAIQEQLDRDPVTDDDFEYLPPASYSHIVIDGLSIRVEDYGWGNDPVAKNTTDTSAYLTSWLAIQPRQALALFFERNPYSRRAHRAAIQLMLASYAAREAGGYGAPIGVGSANRDRVSTALRMFSEAIEVWHASEYYLDRE